MRKRPWWAFNTETWLDDIPGSGKLLALWMTGLAGVTCGIIAKVMNPPASAPVAWMTVTTAGIVFVYCTFRLALIWWKHQLKLNAHQSRSLGCDRASAGTAFADLIDERNSFLGS